MITHKIRDMKLKRQVIRYKNGLSIRLQLKPLQNFAKVKVIGLLTFEQKVLETQNKRI